MRKLRIVSAVVVCLYVVFLGSVAATIVKGQPPIARDDYGFLPDYLPYTVVDVLRNDSDPDGGPLHVATLLHVQGGHAFVLQDNHVLFWWKPGIHSGGAVVYVVEDIEGLQAKAQLRIECCAQEGEWQ